MTSKTLQQEQQKQLRRTSENRDFTTNNNLLITSVLQRAAAPQKVLTRIKELNHYLKLVLIIHKIKQTIIL